MFNNKCSWKTFKAVSLICFMGWFSFQSVGQEMELGIEYMKAGDYLKAKSIFQKLAKNKETAKSIYPQYYQTLVKLKDWEEAEKFVKKQIKVSEGNAKIEADLGKIYELQNKEEEAKKQYEKAIVKATQNEEATQELNKSFIDDGKYEEAIKTLLISRANLKQPTKYATQLARLYRSTGNTTEMVEEYLNFGLANENREYVQAILQDNLKDEKEVAALEKALYQKVQQFPNEPYFNELLIWHLIQEKEFFKAFVQERAMDRRYKNEGNRMMDLGFVAIQNKDYVNGGKAFEYLVKEYPKNANYPLWRRMLINAKEEVVKNTFPVSKDDIRILINEYQKLFEELGMNQKTLEGLRNTAQLYAFYLNEKDTATVVLNKAIDLGRVDQIFVDKCKLDLGDIFLLKNDPWEATLLYSQVEKSEKDSPLGYDAKLRNAKLNYYRGDFELSKEILDILKMATTREIANDALSLSLLIQDNIGMDSTETAMKAYASVELLLFQNRTEEAIEKLGVMLKTFKGHSLEDEMLFLRANTCLKQNEVTKAIEDLELICKNFSIDILGDDALFLLAKTYQEKLAEKGKAMKLYQQLLQKYPGSIYGAESRKRFRNLRGDTIN